MHIPDIQLDPARNTALAFVKIGVAAEIVRKSHGNTDISGIVDVVSSLATQVTEQTSGTGFVLEERLRHTLTDSIANLSKTIVGVKLALARTKSLSVQQKATLSNLHSLSDSLHVFKMAVGQPQPPKA